jgi:hypothetical protein
MNSYGQRTPAFGEDFRAADRMEIVDLVWRILFARDIVDEEMYRDCFTDPVTWDLSNNPVPFTGGPADKGPWEAPRDEFVRLSFNRAEPPSRELFVQHCVNNPIVSFTGADTATVLAHLRNPIHSKSVENGQRVAHDRAFGGLYHIDARKVGDRWRLCALRLSVYGYDPARMGAR